MKVELETMASAQQVQLDEFNRSVKLDVAESIRMF